MDFAEGDAMYLTYGVENMFVNTGEGELWLIYTLTNVPKTRE